ncbi:MAG TPA: prolyl oligopeptidase family serine peptidase [Allosphingosinicella sp.]
MPAAAQAAGTATVARVGGSRIVYHLSRRSPGRRQPILAVFHGSGCEPVAQNPRIPSIGPLLAPRHAMLTIEKYGVPAPADAQTVEDCSADYWRRNTLGQRVLDALQVIAALRRERWWDGNIVLFGGSEGGAVAAMLAPLVPETGAVIVYSSGIGVPVGELVRMAIPPHVAAEAERVYAEARARPVGDLRWGGASYAWWADAADVLPARSLLQTPAPVLLIHGTRDESAPVATARATRDLLARSRRTDFTYREYEGYSHFMVDAGGVDRRPQVLAEAGAWLRRLPRR